MSPRPKVLKFLGLLLVACLAFGVTAGTASAQRHYTAKQKKAISHKLLKQLKKHPKLIRSKSWIRKASAVNFQLPVTIRLNPDIVLPSLICVGAGLKPGCAGPVTFLKLGGLKNSDDTANLDLGASLGKKVLKLGGQVEAYVDFKSPLDGGNSGDVDIVFKDSSSSPTPPLEANPVSVLTNPDVYGVSAGNPIEGPGSAFGHVPQTTANGGCSDRGTDSSLYFGGEFNSTGSPNNWSTASNFPANYMPGTATLTGYPNPVDVDRPENNPWMNTDLETQRNTVLSAGGAYSLTNPNRNLQIGINAAKSGGFANILGNGPSQVKLSLAVKIWTVIRAVDAARGNGDLHGRPASAGAAAYGWEQLLPRSV